MNEEKNNICDFDILKGKRIGFALCGSFCTFERAFETLEHLLVAGCEAVPVMSFNAYSLDTRFGTAREHTELLEKMCGRKIIHTIQDAEPIGPNDMLDVLLVANCTGNTLAKLAHSVTDTPVTMAVKSHLRNKKPVVLSIATNDALAGCSKNIGMIMNFRDYYFVPMRQDDSEKKPTSLISDFTLTVPTITHALCAKQIQPMYL